MRRVYDCEGEDECMGVNVRLCVCVNASVSVSANVGICDYERGMRWREHFRLWCKCVRLVDCV